MGKPRHAFDTHVLLVFLFVAIPFLIFGSFVVITMARGQLRDAQGETLEQQAVHTKLQLERYVGDQIVHLHLLALSQQVRGALAVPSARGGTEADRRLEQAWASGSGPGLTGPLLQSPLAERLRAVLQVRPAVKLLQVVDPAGRVVASTSRRGRYSHADTAWLGTVSGESPDPVPYIGDFQRSPGGGPDVLELAYPVRDPSDGRFLGAVRALVDTTDLYGVLAPVRIGRTGHAVLLRSTDGLVLASDEAEAVLQRPFPGFRFIQAAMEERRGFWTVPELTEQGTQPGESRTEPARLVGFSPVDQVTGVRWLVAVEQHLDEATAPMQAATRYFGLHFLGTVLTVLALAVYFSHKLEEPVIEEELHLHEEHVPVSMRDAGRPAP
jgi:hypothetical protein